MTEILWGIIACGVLAILYAIFTAQSVMKADAGNAKMQEIAGAIREGAQAYLNRQYQTIGIVGAVIFVLGLGPARIRPSPSASWSAPCCRASPATSA